MQYLLGARDSAPEGLLVEQIANDAFARAHVTQRGRGLGSTDKGSHVGASVDQLSRAKRARLAGRSRDEDGTVGDVRHVRLQVGMTIDMIARFGTICQDMDEFDPGVAGVAKSRARGAAG